MNEKLFDFISASPTAYQTVDTLRARLLAEGYEEISESQSDKFSSGGKCFTVRGGASLIAFRGRGNGFMIAAAHSDTPSLRVKESFTRAPYALFDVEKYGGAILYSWLDRPLSLAGRAVIKTKEGVGVMSVDLRRPVALIPSLAIHYNREVNNGYKPSLNKDMLPLFGVDCKLSLGELVAESLGVKKDEILSHDLFLYNVERGVTVGASGELILAPRLDDLECVFAATEAFLTAEESADSVSVLCVLDNEEVGSKTRRGADSTFLGDTLRKIAGCDSKYYQMLENSFTVSADNAHATHPGYPELADRTDSPVLGGGVVVKHNANQRYATDAVSDALIKRLADMAGARLQKFSMRPDLPCGTTLGSIASSLVAVPTVDIGLAQLAMHSSTETAATSDLGEMIKLLRALYSSTLEKRGESYAIK